MKFRTEYETKLSSNPLDPERAVVLLGSCFTDAIGQRMRDCLWNAFPNICGVLYNPASIANILSIALDSKNVFETISESMAERAGIHSTWLMDSGCSSYSSSETKEIAFSKIHSLKEKLADAQALIVTFGTAWIFELRERPGYVVSNCHKFPSDTFLRRRMGIEEIVGLWNACIAKLRESYPGLRIIFTVSPVRHLKDGFEGNSRSKAILQLACEEICRINENVEYFPSYEILNDDLRDYRFYASDLTHPSAEAVDYVWKKFLDRYLTPSGRAILEEGEKVTKALNHRPNILGSSEMAMYMASVEKKKAIERYNTFIAAHPGMLYID